MYKQLSKGNNDKKKELNQARKRAILKSAQEQNERPSRSNKLPPSPTSHLKQKPKKNYE